MHEFLQYHRRMVFFMNAICVAATVAFAVIMRPDMRWAGGFAAGAAAQMFKFAVLDVAAIRKIAVEREAAASTQLKSMSLSLVIFGLAVAAVFAFGLNVWAMAAGIFLPRIILLADAWIRPNPFAGTDGTAAVDAAPNLGADDGNGECARDENVTLPTRGADAEARR